MQEKVPDVRGIARYLKRDSTNIVYVSNVWYPSVNRCVHHPSVATTHWRTYDIIIECNKKIADFLYVTFNLKDGTYKPYQKPDSKIQTIHQT